MLDLGASLGFGAWSLGFRDRFAVISFRLSGSDGECVEEHPRVVPIARAIFHPGDRIRIVRKEAANQSRGDANHCDSRNAVEINFQSPVTDALHDSAAVAAA